MTIALDRESAAPRWIGAPGTGALTDAILEPAATPTSQMDPALGWKLTNALSRVATGDPWEPTRPRVRVGSHQLRSSLGQRAAIDAPPFRWSARTARRAVGLPAVRACVEGRAPTPAEGVTRFLAASSRRSDIGADSGRSLDRWLAALPSPARAAVAAEATTWATALWTSIAWERLESDVEVGGQDEWWTPPGSAVALRGRSDVRTTTKCGGRVLFSMLPGCPAPSARTELGLSALVGALVAAGTTGPVRVVGWWPECARACSIPVTTALLEAVADDVARALGAPGVLGATSGGGPSDR